jgi:hypothetical protein
MDYHEKIASKYDPKKVFLWVGCGEDEVAFGRGYQAFQDRPEMLPASIRLENAT